MTEGAVGERSLTITWEDPRASAEPALRLSGLEFWRGLVDGSIPRPPLAWLLGMMIVEADEGRALFDVTPGEQHYNPIGTVHGGIAATILDSAMGAAIHTTLPAGWSAGTLDLSVRFLRPISAQTGRVLCEGVVMHRGRSAATAEGRLWAEESGKLLAHGTGSAVLRQLDQG
jgi:uncharacterized protein (TIGR00369 family)